MYGLFLLFFADPEKLRCCPTYASSDGRCQIGAIRGFHEDSRESKIGQASFSIVLDKYIRL